MGTKNTTIEGVKLMIKDGHITQDVAERYIPELKESEDEMIRKELITHCRNTRCVTEEGAERIAKWIAWLEKQGSIIIKLSEEEQNQFAKGVLTSCALSFINYLDAHKYEGKMCVSNGECEDIENAFHNAMWDRLHRYYCKYIENQGEQKPVDKIEPKFHKGEWLCENEPNNYARFIQILEIVNVQGKERYRISRDIHNDEDVVEFDFVEKYYHKFDIKDAKDGDVLSYENEVFIVKKSVNLNILYYCCYDGEHFIIDSFYSLTIDDINNIRPATKEQRDQLKKAMVNAGYECDADKKELKKIESQQAEIQKWSEEDEDNLTDTCVAIRKFYHGINGAPSLINWLQSLKERFTWKPSDKQIIALRWVLNNIPYNKHKEEISGLLDQIKDL